MPCQRSSRIKKINPDDLLDSYCVLDLETTGLSANYDKIVEVAILKIKNNEIVDTFHTLINPCIPISVSASMVNHIYDDMVQDSPLFSDVMDSILSFLGEDTIIGHNISFDLRFLNANLNTPLTNPHLDTMVLSRIVYPQLSHHRLSDLQEYLNLTSNTHRALADCITTKELYDHIKYDHQ